MIGKYPFVEFVGFRMGFGVVDVGMIIYVSMAI